ncbi:hypothetical protein JX265_009832 [Neoarthrinium moseri]|uniref:RING-type domain-containing protein n=1 Tax=Neoarthrinium moseri TaxID=1658444 RepID=A0A9Q0AL46_9PEZI|nr:uncharacterized protein JN550_005415 [Neoarthrinium moseri]KAI1852858.1 hypothetical protein JX266_002399 [Neoarthrinium moseri]KAI1860433.1 hypothetical protein JX265_009832 [Neoarthrinium moseri]KAI1869825.1 hypothetical protein JN550_005415 [Neoarthrinium moseri]
MRVRKLVSLPVRLPLRIIHKIIPKIRRSRFETTTIESTTDGKSAALAEKERHMKETEPPLEDCPICHDPVGIANPEGTVESWTSLHCGHRFGTVCIQMWLQDSLDRNDPQNPHPSCPICRVVAKHPVCGHLVCPTQDFELQWNMYQLQLQYQYQAAQAATLHRRPRNRLQRREGHPSRPSLTPPRRTADQVGECGTCAERVKSRIEATAVAQEQQGSDSRSSSKPMLPLPRVLVGALRSNGEPSSPLMGEREIRGRSMICNLEEVSRVPRSPTPGPVGGLLMAARRSTSF